MFRLYYSQVISTSFIECLDNQTSTSYERATLLRIDNRTWLGLVAEKHDFFYVKDAISKMPCPLHLPYLGRNEVTICWKSKSGRIYDITDEDIDCNDIEFWFENLDVELCRKATNPKWTLIPEIYQSHRIEMFEKDSGIKMSPSFMACLDEQLSACFTKLTGIKITKRVSITLSQFQGDKPFFISDTVSKFQPCIVINDNWNAIDVLWKSQSGRIYQPLDDVDCDDIEFWFGNFQAELFIKQYYPNQQLTFKIKDISCDLVVTRINLDCTILLTPKKEAVENAEAIVNSIDEFINDFNEKSERKDRVDGVIHNWNTEIRNGKLIYNLDLGSTGVLFFKKLLTYLSKMNTFTKVEIQ